MVMPFIMSCAKLELVSCCCLLDARGHEIRIYAMLLFGCSVKMLVLATCEKSDEFIFSLDRKPKGELAIMSACFVERGC